MIVTDFVSSIVGAMKLMAFKCPNIENIITHNQRLGLDLKKLHKNLTKGIDPCRGVGIGSARRHDGGRPRDKASIAVRTTRSAF